MNILFKFLKSVMIFIMAGYFLLLGLLYVLQDSLVFPAPAAVTGALPEDAQYALMQTSDGETLHHVRMEGKEGAPKVLFFHGNGTLAAYELARGRALNGAGFDVLLAEYRGYGASTGKPSADALLRDALETYDWYVGGSVAPVLVYGHSLGTGIAAHIAENREVNSVVLEAPYTALSDVAADRYPLFPVRALFRHEINALKSLKNADVPTLILHGERDGIIPLQFGRDLYGALARDNVSIRQFPDAGHNDLTRHGSIIFAVDHFKASIASR